MLVSEYVYCERVLLQKDEAYARLKEEKVTTMRLCKKGVTEAARGKKSAGKGRGKVQKLWETIHGSLVRRRRVKLSRMLLLSCPHAEAFTYATRLGTNVVDDIVIDIRIPKEYIVNAIKFAESEVQWAIVNQAHH